MALDPATAAAIASILGPLLLGGGGQVPQIAPGDTTSRPAQSPLPQSPFVQASARIPRQPQTPAPILGGPGAAAVIPPAKELPRVGPGAGGVSGPGGPAPSPPPPTKQPINKGQLALDVLTSLAPSLLQPRTPLPGISPVDTRSSFRGSGVNPFVLLAQLRAARRGR